MKRIISPVFLLLILAAPLAAQSSPPKVLQDDWYVIRTERGRVGYFHYGATEVQREGAKLIRTVWEQESTYRETTGEPYSTRSLDWMLETPDGTVVEVGYDLALSDTQMLRLQGKVADGKLTLRVHDQDGKPTRFSRTVPWDDGIRGSQVLERRFRTGLKAGETFRFKEFDFVLHRCREATYRVIEPEFVRVGREMRKLLRVEQSFPSNAYSDNCTLWLDDRGLALRMEVAGSYYELSDQATARAPLDPPEVSVTAAAVRFSKPVPVMGPKPRELLVRIMVEDDDNPATMFPQTARQTIVKSDKTSVTLRLLSREPALKEPLKDTAPPAKEYLASNFFVRSDDPQVQKLAKQVVGELQDRRSQVRAICRWVEVEIEPTYKVNHATADEVARIRKGDCTECSVLAAAMCRAVGIPSRIVVGWVATEDGDGVEGHQWIEAHVDGRWQTFDPTGVLGSVNAAWIEFADYSMDDVLDPEGLIENTRVVCGAVRVEVLQNK